MIAKLLITLLILVLAQSSNNITPPATTIQIEIQLGHNTYSGIQKYFRSQQKIQITDMISIQDNKAYHFCYIQSLLNSNLIEQDCLRLSNTSKDNIHCSYNNSIIGQKSITTTQSPILYKLNDIIQGESVLETYHYDDISVMKSGDNSVVLRTEYVLVVKSKAVVAIRLDEKCVEEQLVGESNKQQNNTTTKCQKTQSVIQLSLQGQASKAKFIELNSQTLKTINSNNYKQLLLVTQSHIYTVQLFTGNQTQGLQSNVVIELLVKLENIKQQEKEQYPQDNEQGNQYDNEEIAEQFTTFIIDKRDNINNSKANTTINLLLFTNKKNAHLYKLSTSPNNQIKLQSKSISPLDTDSGTLSENKDLHLLTLTGGYGVEGEVVYYMDGNKESGILLVAGKSVGDVKVSADVGTIFNKYDRNNNTNNKSINNNNTINTANNIFYTLPNTQRCHKIHQYKNQYVFLQCKNHLLYFRVKELVECFNKEETINKQQCLNSVKQSHLNIGFHIQSANFELNQQEHYLTVTTLDKYSHFYIDYCSQTQTINSINNIATYYYSNQTLKSVYRTNGGRSIILTKRNAVLVKQQEEEKEIYCRTVDENSRKELAQPVGRFTGSIVIQGVCKDALLINNDTLIIQSIQNSTLCRYKVPTVVTITHTVNKYKSIWQILLATGLTTTLLSLIFCVIKSRKLKQIYNILEEEKEHGHKVMQGSVVTQVNQSHEESIGAGSVLGK